IFGVTTKLAAVAISPDKGIKGFNAIQSHSNKLNISNSFLLFATENTYFLSVSGSVGTSDILLDKLEITVVQKFH
ncbi:hypothetical protein HOB94_05270, partial [bacterium]|nr:hypothetical protein [bacterium]